MAYGNGNNLLRRAVPAGKTPLDGSVLPSGKLEDLIMLRECYIAAANTLVEAVFTEEPLSGLLAAKDMQALFSPGRRKSPA